MALFDSRHSLILGGLRLSTWDQVADPAGWTLDVLGEDFSLGNPAPVEMVVASMLRDGDLTRTDRDGNREASFRVTVTAVDGQALALGEKALADRLFGPAELWWQPPDDAAPVTVFDVLDSGLEWLFDDVAEMTQRRRTFRVWLKCLPYGRSAAKVTAAAVTTVGTPTTVTLDDGAGAGWSTLWVNPSEGGALPAPTRAGGIVSSPQLLSPGSKWDGTYYTTTQGKRMRKTFAAAVDMSATTYLVTDVEVFQGYEARQRGLASLTVFADGQQLMLLATAPLAGSARVRHTWLCTDTSITTVEFGLDGGGLMVEAEVYVDLVQRTNVAPVASSTGREKQRTLRVEGSARAPASIQVASPGGTALGSTVVYTGPALVGFSPSLSTYATPGITNAQSVSGYDRQNSMVAKVPAGRMLRGGYALWAVLAPSTGGVVNVTVSARSMYGATAYGDVWTEIVKVTLPTYSAFQLVPLTVLTLPLGDCPPSASASVEISVSLSGWVDDVFLFHLGAGAGLTVVDCGTAAPAAGGSSSRLWIDAPTPETLRPSLWVGTQANRGDARSPGSAASSWGVHDLKPGDNEIFTATTGAADHVVTVDYYPRWRHNAAA